ncbi:expressed unknown protein [Ectocarpus siliculosus]|uniref:Uncharacterized protein n=1 Tax=Ectocarpus siliculosus TaxID=2880 RepID=D8LBT6_ECTSI|nr:expressed unknown protein [Ectocarpus siliculosus]|eukprot:CBN76795.1 expressed unknown protein [Ectocarpus siliculosus]
MKSTLTAESCRREVRELRLQCRKLSSSNDELKLAADARRKEACASRRRADAAQKELEAERKSGVVLRRVRDALQVAAAADRKSIDRLQGQLCKGSPSSRLLDKARCLKRTVEELESKSTEQAEALSAKTAELEASRREARALAAALGVRAEKASLAGVATGPVTVDELLEVGRAKLMNHDLALGMARLSEASGVLASEKQELEDLLVKKTAEIERCKAQTTEVQGELERERKVADGHRAAAAEANASTREARGLAETLRSKEEELREELKVAASQREELEGKLVTLSEAADRGEVMRAKAESLQAELDARETALSTETQKNEHVAAQLGASKESLYRAQQRLEELEGVTRENRRLEALLQEEAALQAALREDVNAAKEELRVAVAERGELMRGLRQAKVFNDELAKGKEKAEERERAACAQCIDTKEGKLALQRALLEQLSASRAELREEQKRCQKAEATLGRLADSAAKRSRNRGLPPLEDDGESDEGASVSFEESDGVSANRSIGASGTPTTASAAVTSSFEPPRPRDTLVQDYLGREGAEQFLSDWDEERSSASSLSFSSLPLQSPLSTGGRSHGGSRSASFATGRPTEVSLRAQPWTPPPPPPRPPIPPLPPEELPSLAGSSGQIPWASDSPGHTTKGSAPCPGAPERGEEPSTAAATAVAAAAVAAARRLRDPDLKEWTMSMVALGKVARAGAGRTASDVVVPPQKGFGDGPSIAAAIAPSEADRFEVVDDGDESASSKGGYNVEGGGGCRDSDGTGVGNGVGCTGVRRDGGCFRGEDVDEGEVCTIETVAPTASAAAVGVVERGPKSPRQQCSLLDLADQSIDEI